MSNGRWQDRSAIGHSLADSLFLVELEEITLSEVVKAGDADTALKAGLDLSHVLFEPLQGIDTAFIHDIIIAKDTDERIAGGFAICHDAAAMLPRWLMRNTVLTSAWPVVTSA